MADAPLMLVAAAALVDAQGRVLVQQRPPGKSLAGLWEFPGGKLEPGETPMAALIRELREELAIDVAEADLMPVSFADESVGPQRLLLLLYLTRHWLGTPVAMEATALAWHTPDGLASLAMPPADRPLVEALRSHL